MRMLAEEFGAQGFEVFGFGRDVNHVCCLVAVCGHVGRELMRISGEDFGLCRVVAERYGCLPLLVQNTFAIQKSFDGCRVADNGLAVGDSQKCHKRLDKIKGVKK